MVMTWGGGKINRGLMRCPSLFSDSVSGGGAEGEGRGAPFPLNKLVALGPHESQGLPLGVFPPQVSGLGGSSGPRGKSA